MVDRVDVGMIGELEDGDQPIPQVLRTLGYAVSGRGHGAYAIMAKASAKKLSPPKFPDLRANTMPP